MGVQASSDAEEQAAEPHDQAGNAEKTKSPNSQSSDRSQQDTVERVPLSLLAKINEETLRCIADLEIGTERRGGPVGSNFGVTAASESTTDDLIHDLRILVSLIDRYRRQASKGLITSEQGDSDTATTAAAAATRPVQRYLLKAAKGLSEAAHATLAAHGKPTSSKMDVTATASMDELLKALKTAKETPEDVIPSLPVKTEVLDMQARVDDDLRPYQCLLCARQFGRDDQLLYHLRMHEAVMPFACKDCDERFQTLHALEAHEETPHLRKADADGQGGAKRRKVDVNDTQGGHKVQTRRRTRQTGGLSHMLADVTHCRCAYTKAALSGGPTCVDDECPCVVKGVVCVGCACRFCQNKRPRASKAAS